MFTCGATVCEEGNIHGCICIWKPKGVARSHLWMIATLPTEARHLSQIQLRDVAACASQCDVESPVCVL